MSEHYNENGLKPNPSKTNVSAFHLKNRQARCSLYIIWDMWHIVRCHVTSALHWIKHQPCCNLKQKISTRNNLLTKLARTIWCAHHIIYEWPGLHCVTWKSTPTSQMVRAFSDTCHIVTGCLLPTSLGKLFILVGIATPGVRSVTQDVK